MTFRSIRHGIAHFAIGGLKAVASVIFDQTDPVITIQQDLSTAECKNHFEDEILFLISFELTDSYIVFSVQFNNTAFEAKKIINFPTLPDLTMRTFFSVNKTRNSYCLIHVIICS